MRPLRTAFVICMAVASCLMSAGLSSAAVVTMDVVARTAKSDVDSLEMFAPQVSGQQAGICVNNKAREPQLFTLRFTGLTEAEYDLYVNGSLKGTRSRQLLEQGLDLQVEGSIADTAMIRCLTNVPPGAQRLHSLVKGSKGSEERFVSNAMEQVLDWARLTLLEEQVWKSVRVIVAPRNKPMETMEWIQRHTDYETAAIITNTCWSLQQARDQIYHRVKNTQLRNDAIVAITPAALTVYLTSKNGKPHVIAKLLNNCDIPLKGTFTLGLPKGWKTSGGKMSFAGLKSGQTYTLTCDLVGPSKSAAAPKEVPVSVNVLIIQLDKSAAMKLTATAKAPSK